MPPNPELEAAKRKWAEGAQMHLGVLTEVVAALRGAFESDNSDEAEPPDGIASDVVSVSADLMEWLGVSRAPRGLRKAEGELAATAGVYRNAAVAFGSLTDANPDQCAARRSACARLLNQGDHHAETFDTLVQKKLGGS